MDGISFGGDGGKGLRLDDFFVFDMEIILVGPLEQADQWFVLIFLAFFSYFVEILLNKIRVGFQQLVDGVKPIIQIVQRLQKFGVASAVDQLIYWKLVWESL